MNPRETASPGMPGTIVPSRMLSALADRFLQRCFIASHRNVPHVAKSPRSSLGSPGAFRSLPDPLNLFEMSLAGAYMCQGRTDPSVYT